MKQTVFSALSDMDRNKEAYKGLEGGQGKWEGGVRTAAYPAGVAVDNEGHLADGASYSAIMDYFEACWWNQWSQNVSKDQ